MRILAVDYGTNRLGFAISDPSGIIALPMKVHPVQNDKDAIKAVLDASSETGAEKLLLGLPLNMDGSRGTMVEKVEKFVTVLRKKVSISVETWDERLSTCMAEKILLEADMTRKKRKITRDKIAAQIILQSYLDAQQPF